MAERFTFIRDSFASWRPCRSGAAGRTRRPWIWVVFTTLCLVHHAIAVDAPPGISVPDSPGAADLLVKAADKEQQNQWRAAADLYEQIMNTYPRRVAPVTTDKDNGVFAYAGLVSVVQDHLAKWPLEGLDTYRSTYGAAAATKLAATDPHDAASLQQIFDRYFVTEAGKTAGLQLIAARMDAGQFRAAAWTGERLLASHPTLGARRGATLFATGLAEFFVGDMAAATAKSQELALKHAGETAAIGGHDVVMSDRLAQIISGPRPRPFTSADAADHWPTFNGPGGRGDVLPSLARPGLSPRPVLLNQPRLPSLAPQQKPAFEAEDQQDLLTGQLMGVMPVADGGELFFQDGRTLYALDADSGLPLPGWVQTFGVGQSGQFKADTFGRARGEQCTLTLTPNRVLAVMGQPDRIAPTMGQMTASDVRLICLDRATGKSIWTRSPADLPESSGVARTGEYDGTPLVAGADTVLIVARGSKGAQFEDCYVVALSLRTGEYQWSTYIGSANRPIDAEIGTGPHDNSQLSMAEGRVFVLSNLGTVAALDPTDGRLLWLNAYPRVADAADAAAAFMRNHMNNRAMTKPWAQNPVIVAGGNVFVLPSDGKNLLVYDAGSGREIKRIVNDDYDGMDVLLGVQNDWVVTTSDAGCFCIDWAHYDHDHSDDAIVAKHDNFDDTVPGVPNTVFGRGFVTTTDIFVPTRRRLYRIGFNRSGKVLETYPVRGAWGGDSNGQSAGNVLVTARNVVVAGSMRVDLYTDAELARKKYNDEVAAAPSDPAPRTRFAEVLFASGQADAALEKLNEAIDLIGGPKSPRSGTGRSQIFSTSLTFAQDAGRNAIAEINSFAGRYFDLAAVTADTPPEQATYRLARAAFDHDHHDYAGEVELCQQVLTDPVTRAVPLSDDITAGQAAKTAIDGAIAQDRASYATVEELARAALHAAADSHDADRLFAIADVYPNSAAAGDALKAAAAAMERSGDHASAVRTLSRMYAATTEGKARTALIEAIARNQLAMPDGVGPAIDRLSHGVQTPDLPMLAQPMPLPDGTVLENVSFATAVDRLRKLQTRAETAALPDIKVPARSRSHLKAFTADTSATIADVTLLLHAATGFDRSDRVVTWSLGTGLSIRAASLQGSPVNVEMPNPPVAIAWTGDVLRVWSPQSLVELDDEGKVHWRVSLGGLPAMSVSTGGQAFVDEAAPTEDTDSGQQLLLERRRRVNQFGLRINRVAVGINPPAAVELPRGPERMAYVRPVPNRVVIGTSIGRIFAIDSTTGKVVWASRPADHAVDQLLVNNRFTVARLNDTGGSQLLVLDTVDGHVIGRRKFGADGSATQLVNAALSEDATLAFTLFNRLMIKDLTEPWKDAPVELTGRPNSDSAPFVGLDQADQLLIHGGRVIALYDGGKFVRTRDLTSMNDPETPLATGADSAAVSLRLVGPRLFAAFDKSFRQYNLSDHSDHYAPEPYELDWVPRIRELLITRGDAVLVDAPADHGPNPLPFVRLLMYARYPANNHTTRESGKLDFDPMIQEPSGIVGWQAVDGGFVYLAGNQVLHRLAGAAEQ